MSNFYSANTNPYSQQQQENQQQGQPSSSYYGQTSSTNNNTSQGLNPSPYGQSTSEQPQMDNTTGNNSGNGGGGGQESSWQPSSFAAAPSSSATTANTNPQQYQPQQYQPSSQAHAHAQQQQHQQHHPQQPAVVNPNVNIWNPAAFTQAAGVASAVMSGNQTDAMNMGMAAGKHFLDEGIARMIPGLEKSMVELRVYFAVNNGYVKRKMGRVLFPFFNKEWRRMTIDGIGIHKFALPHTDDNALDLYLPSMSLITYVLLCALCYGAVGQFSPEVLPDIITGCVATQIFEVILFRLGFYMMQAPIAILDLMAITGYKYLGLAMCMLVGVVMEVFLESGSGRGYYVAFVWTATAVSYFVLKTMAGFVPEVTSAKGPKREFMLLAFGASQFLTMWFLGQTKYLK